MIALFLFIVGLCIGSFINASVWRLHKQSTLKKKSDKQKYSISRGRSMCDVCGHQLAAKDLIPVVSWLSLGGKCRYCKNSISPEHPLIELLTAVLFLGSYLWWPWSFDTKGIVLYIFWLVFLSGFVALTVYDLKWFLLPDKIVRPLFVLALVQVLLLVTIFGGGKDSLLNAFWGLLIGGGLFYTLFQVSGGKWIGGGDVKLGGMLGLLIGGPAASLLLLFLASFLGTIVAIPLLVTGKAKRDTHLPFGPFLIAAAIIVYVFGASIIAWYHRQFLFY